MMLRADIGVTWDRDEGHAAKASTATKGGEQMKDHRVYSYSKQQETSNNKEPEKTRGMDET